MHFEFTSPQRIIFGPGIVRELPNLIKSFGSRALVITGSTASRSAPLLDLAQKHSITCVQFVVSGEPTIEQVCEGIALAKDSPCDCVVGFGGGSVIDAAKAIAVMLTNPGHPLDYVEVIGKGQTLRHASVPIIAIPTTAGTGSEATRNAVLGSSEQRVKVSMRSPLMLPRIALVDPELTYSLPAHITAASGLDALTQLIEPYVSSRANHMTDAICRDGLSRAARSLHRVYDSPQNLSARADMALASLHGGLALANAGLGAVHGIAGPLGGMFKAPHGAVCAALLPHVMEMNIKALSQRAANHPALIRYAEIAQTLTRSPQARALDGMTWIAKTLQTFQIPKLSAYGVQQNDLPVLVQKSMAASSMKANPIALTANELIEIIEKAL
jgi:alcohol dehydrogenase class IV